VELLRGRGPQGFRLFNLAARGPTSALAGLCFIVALIVTGGCDRSADASRTLIAGLRASWTREIAGLKSQHLALVARLGSRGTDSSDGPAAMRARAVVDGTRQSITDVESQLAQAEGRMEQAVRRGGDAGERAIEEESVKARGYLQALGEELVEATQQLDQFSRTADESQKQAL